MIAPKRLVIFRPTLGEGGADRVTITLLKYLDRRKFAPALVLTRREGVLLEQVPADVPVITLQARRLGTSWIALARYLRAEKPDIVFSTSSGGNTVAALAHWLSGHRSRLVLSERNTFSIARRERLPRWLPVERLKRPLYRRADVIAAVSRGVADDLVATLRLPADQVSVVYNPVDVDAAAPAPDPAPHPWLTEPIPVVLAVGRLVPQKGYPVLLDAFAAVRRIRAARLLVLGEGPLRGSLQTQVESRGLSDDVRFLGFVTNPHAFMRRCAVYVLSSVFEGFPNALIEAMRCGAPVISTDCPSGPREIITEPGRNGLLVPVGDAQALADAIDTVLSSPPLRATLAQEGQRRAAAFRHESIVAAYERVLLPESLGHDRMLTPA